MWDEELTGLQHFDVEVVKSEFYKANTGTSFFSQLSHEVLDFIPFDDS